MIVKKLTLIIRWGGIHFMIRSKSDGTSYPDRTIHMISYLVMQWLDFSAKIAEVLSSYDRGKVRN